MGHKPLCCSRTKRFATAISSALILVLAIISATISASAQDSATASSSGSRRIRLLIPGSPEFDSIVKSQFSVPPPACCGPSFASPQVIISNGTAFGLRALTLAWTLKDGGGRETTFFTTLFPEPMSPILLPGRRNILDSGNYAIISPFYHAETNLPETANLPPRYQETAAQVGLADNLRDATSIHVRIDAAIFSNGVILGPDRSALSKRFTVEQQGAIEEAKYLLSLPNSQESIERTLEADEEVGRSPEPSEELSSNAAARGREASRLRDLLNHSGLLAFHAAISQLAMRTATKIERYALSGSL